MSPVAGFALTFLVAGIATPLLAWLANRSGWVDASRGPDAERKLQQRPVPPVGGAAILLALVVLVVVVARESEGLALGRQGLAVLGAFAVAFGLGTLDDLRPGGLGPAAKLGGQLIAGAFVGLSWAPTPILEPHALGAWQALGWMTLGASAAVVALNAVNTFDNADGAAASLGALALGPVYPPLAGALLGFLPWNLSDPRGAGRSAPRAYLGDAGSHLVGILILFTPAAWPVLALPLLDLARVSVLRVRAGARPWHGDRRHLAHELARSGLGPRGVALALALIALPSAIGAGLDAGDAGHARAGLATALGLVGTALGFWFATRHGRAPRTPAAQ